MRKLALAMAAIGAVCAHAEAAVYTTSASVARDGNDANPLQFTAFVPNFDLSLGTLLSTTVTITGSVAETLAFYQGTPPTSGAFVNTIQIGVPPSVVLSTVPITSGSFVSPTTLQDNFRVNYSVTLPATYTARPGTDLDVSLSLFGTLQTPACCFHEQDTFFGTLTAAYNYTPVPEPFSASLLLAPALGLIGLRRRA